MSPENRPGPRRRRRFWPVPVPTDLRSVRPAGSFILDRAVPVLFVALTAAAVAIVIVAAGILTGVIETG